MKKCIPIFIITVFVFLLNPKPTQAHFLATDGTIGAVLHVDPNDDPIAKQQASFFFEFKDKQNKFQAKNCYCRIDLYEQGKIIYSDTLFQNANPSLTNASFFYTFAQKDVYTIKVIGIPRITNAFQSFALSWDFRVDQEVNPQSTRKSQQNFFGTHIAHFVVIGIILAFIIFSLFMKLFEKKKVQNNNHQQNENKEIY